MLTNIGVPGLIVILLIALVIFGPKKLPELGKATGETLKEFKKSAQELTADSLTDEENSGDKKSVKE
ncbi:twin-arginine translocase TatA/TatE family subunit [Bacillus marinisedimentorum]|uniref:twin-arginine translocase TatA/TatE family subunit n=1 Tax=Bacillus marinisedimentorum TaxID=1821260 RepID=UPI0007DF7EE1|nr:twin-arginine translocase TatA/TatE family subunit [Bacillus marinisedimentorum]